MSIREIDPLFGDEQVEIPLESAPLVRVVAQVRFSPIMMIRKLDFIAPFQERIRRLYPHVTKEVAPLIAPIALEAEPQHEVHWRFYCPKRHWRVSLTSGFVTLETQRYTSREDFTERFREVVEALHEAVASASVTRIGVRYVDHVRTPEFDGVTKMLRPEMLGILSSSLGAHLGHAINETVCPVREDGHLLARWGVLPSNGTHDLDVLSPVSGPSWFLDLDVYQEFPEPFVEMDPQAIHRSVFALATRAYTFFRWAVTDDFLAVYGGKT